MPTDLDLKSVAKGAYAGGAAAGAIGIALYFAGSAMGADFKPMHPEQMMNMEKLPFFQPMVICLLAATVSVGVLAVLGKVAGAKAWPVYLGLAGLVFLGEAYAPFWAFADGKTIATLEIMHIPATLGIVGGIWMHAIKGR